MIGTKGAILLPHIDYPSLHPQAKSSIERSRGRVPEPLSRVPGCRAEGPGTKCSANLDYAALVTEAVLLGTVALHHPSETMDYDCDAMQFEGGRDRSNGFSRRYREQYLQP